MSKCNLLRPICGQGESSTDSTFFMFSQYAEDLSKQLSDGDAYRVVPSKFAAFDTDYSGMSNADVGTLWQNKFEHSVASWRAQLATDEESVSDIPDTYTPDMTSLLFWKTFSEFDESLTSLRYVGETDTCGTTEVQGDCYAEIYSVIPNEATQRTYHTEQVAGYAVEPSVGSQTAYGWTSSTYPTNTGIGISDRVEQLHMNSVLVPIILKSETDQNNEYSNAYYDEETEEEVFSVNTVAVFYDIVCKDENGDYQYLYTNIPLGIYFTGPVQGDTLTNEVTKYVSNGDIYGQGTSYGLRITARFSASPTVSNVSPDVEVTHSVDNRYPEFAAALSSMSRAADALMMSAQRENERTDTLKEHLNQFSNKKTNVPYIREIDGMPHWFVNGRSTGVRVWPETDPDLQSQFESEIAKLRKNIQDSLEEAIRSTAAAAENYFSADHITSVRPADLRSHAPNSCTEVSDNILIAQIREVDGYRGAGLFSGYENLVRLPKTDFSYAESLDRAFKDCKSLRKINLRDSSMCESFKETFSGCSSLVHLELDASSAASDAFQNAFDGCTDLEDIRISGLKGGTEGSPMELDFSDTKIDYYSLMYIIENVRTSRYYDDDSEDDDRFYDKYITIKVPNTITTEDYELIDAMYRVQENKYVYITLES